MSKYSFPISVESLASELARLPGIGPKLASRLAIYLSIKGAKVREQLVVRLAEMAERITVCRVCGNLADTSAGLCAICEDEARDKGLMMVVESPLDIYQIEKADAYQGVYHVLGGVISPVNGVTPQDLNLEQLYSRLKETTIEEVILAFSGSVEGEATAMYIANVVEKNSANTRVTRLAKGLASGVNIEYVDPGSLQGAIKNRVGVSS